MQHNSYALKNCDDNTLAILVKNGDNIAFEIMCKRYLNLISSIAKKYRNSAMGYELSDFIQEGLIGFLSACKTYDNESVTTFKNYAMLCVENRFRSIYRHENKKGTVPSSNLVPIDESVNLFEDTTELSMQELLESKEYIKTVFLKIEGVLTELEKKVLSLHLSGYSYKQTAKALGISEKSVDNTLYRIRKKLSR